MKENSATPPFPAHRQAIYNPNRLTDAEVKASYIARPLLLDIILEDIDATPVRGIPQHHLIVGQRGMGKTTLLRRLDVALREPARAKRFIPLSFPEEQWAVDRLSKLWLNCLDAVADTLEREGVTVAAVRKIDQIVDRLRVDHETEESLSEASEASFLAIAARLGRRPVLLIDNLDLVFGRLKAKELNRLRGFLMTRGAPVLVGACVAPPTTDYDSPFYDQFKTHYLERLSLEEMRDVLLQLSKSYGTRQMELRLDAERPRLRALHALTGGNPRTTVILFQIFSKGFSQEAYQDLEALLDWITPFYKARFEELASQSQVVVSALATNWEPATLARICEVTFLDNRHVSSQLDRLRKMGVVEDVIVDPDDRVGPLTEGRSPRSRTGYQLAERFFNIWFLMRQATRRDRRSLTFLTRFIECVHSTGERSAMARDLLQRRGLSREERIYGLALEPAIADHALRYELHDHVQQEIVEASTELQEKVDELIDLAEISPHRFGFAELRGKLKSMLPVDSKLTPDEFADAVLGSPALVPRRSAIASQILDVETAQELVSAANQDAQLLERFGDVESARWFQNLLRRGTLVDFSDADQLNEVFRRADTHTKALLCSRYAQWPSEIELTSEAAATIRRFFRPSSDEAPATEWMRWAYILFQAFKDYEEALGVYKRVAERDPSKSEPWVGIGLLLGYHLQRRDEAIAALQTAASLDPENISAWVMLAAQLRELNRDSEAVAAIRSAIRIEPNRSSHLLTLGNLLAEDSHAYPEAERTFRKATEVDPQNSNTWRQWGMFLEEHVKKYDEAEAAYREAIRIAPLEWGGWFRLGCVLLEHLDRFQEAEEAYRKAAEFKSSEPSLWSLVGLAAQASKHYTEAVLAYRKAILLDPNDGLSWFSLATILDEQLSRDDDAEAAYRKAVELDPTNAPAWASLGGLLIDKRDRYDEGIAAYRKATEIDPTDEYAWNQLGLALADCSNESDEAARAFRKAMEINPQDALAPTYNLISVLRDQAGQLGAAADILAKLRKPSKRTLRAGIILQEALFAAYSEQWTTASEALSKALDLIAEHPAFPPDTFAAWMRASAVMLHLGYGEQMLDFLSIRGDAQRLRPWYEALRAHVRGDRRYLRNTPVEVRPLAGALYDRILVRLCHLPLATRRWTAPQTTGLRKR